MEKKQNWSNVSLLKFQDLKLFEPRNTLSLYKRLKDKWAWDDVGISEIKANQTIYFYWIYEYIWNYCQKSTDKPKNNDIFDR